MNHKEQRATELKEKRPQAGYCGFYNRIIKRIVDFILSLVAAVVVTPIVFVIGIFIAIEDGFPVLYTPLRGGYRGKAFRIFKLRTMYKDADKLGGTTALNDPRITRMGKALRKLKLDELPQVYNVLLGSMSFIGPRPELLRYTEAYKDEEKIILEVRPGITDFSSIEFISLDEIVGAENADEMYEKHKEEMLDLLGKENDDEKTQSITYQQYLDTSLDDASFTYKIDEEGALTEVDFSVDVTQPQILLKGAGTYELGNTTTRQMGYTTEIVSGKRAEVPEKIRQCQAQVEGL